MFLSKANIVAALLVATATHFHTASAIDYVGGWLPSPPGEQCVDICVGANPKPTCPTADPACLAKKQVARDYDYLLLEEMFVPQFCRDLLLGVDFTISHQNVNKYPDGIACVPEVVKSELTIHGLWPNYNAGYAGCCNVSESIGNHPYNALDFATEQPALMAKLSKLWIDPTQSNAYDALCEIYNHEFQKHGICYGGVNDDYAKSAVVYFQSTLNAAAVNKKATNQINKWAKAKKPQTTLAKIQALYPKYVQVLCSKTSGGNQFAAIRSCFVKPTTYGANVKFTPMDCAAAVSSSSFVPCVDTEPITLAAYTPPQ